MDLSISIVSFNTKDLLRRCLHSIYKHTKGIRFEIIIVDNGSKDGTVRMVNKEFPKLKLIAYKSNQFFTKANNQAFAKAKGKYFLILNADTYIKDNAFKKLVDYMEKNPKVGAAEGLEIYEDGKLVPNGSKLSTPLIDFYELSIFGRLFKNQKAINSYRLVSKSRRETFEIDVGCDAFLIVRSDLFAQIGEYDEQFLLYYTENDLCKRIKDKGFKITHFGKSHVIHTVSASANTLGWKKADIYYSDLLTYYKKHGFALSGSLLFSLLKVEQWILMLRENKFLMGILILAAFLRFYKLNELMPFIGDFGWFYLSAKDAILSGTIPLVGITSSHTWLHQGPLWTYILVFLFWLFGFHPLVPGYFIAILGIITVWLVYKVGKDIFSENTGIIAAALYATSPLVVVHSRMPYHTSPIPFFTLLFFYSAWKWVKGNNIYFPVSVFLLVVLYNFELATQVLWFVLLVIIGLGIWRKQNFVYNILSKKILTLSLLGFIIPMLPIIVYDFSRGFPQTLKFAAWIGYKALGGGSSIHSISELSTFGYIYAQRLLFLLNQKIALALLFTSIGYALWQTLMNIRRKQYFAANNILFFTLLIPLFGFLVNKTPSEAYLPMLFPVIIVSVAILFAHLLEQKVFFSFVFSCVLAVALLNSISLVKNDYLMNQTIGYGPSFERRLSVAKQIIHYANGRPFNLVGQGEGSEFASFIMNYEYLTGWLGNGSSKKDELLKFVIEEKEGRINIKPQLR